MLQLPKVLLMGLRKSGKSSIQGVVFRGMQPHESVGLPTTVVPEKATMPANGFLNFEVWDFPGQNDPFDPSHSSCYDVEELLKNCGVIVFVLDCRDQGDFTPIRLVDTICAAHNYNPNLCVEVFIHKVDALSEDHQTDLFTSLQRKVEEEVSQRLNNPKVDNFSFNLTSIYDHSVFQAFSLVVQRLIKYKQPKINELLQMLNSNCNSDVSYLFLSRSKIFLAIDEFKRRKLRSYDLCCDAIEVLIKMDQTYNKSNIQDTLEGAPDNGLDTNGSDVTSPKFRGARTITHLKNESCIYVRELPNSLTIVMMIKQSEMSNKVLIDKNIDICYNAAYKILSSPS